MLGTLQSVRGPFTRRPDAARRPGRDSVGALGHRPIAKPDPFLRLESCRARRHLLRPSLRLSDVLRLLANGRQGTLRAPRRPGRLSVALSNSPPACYKKPAKEQRQFWSSGCLVNRTGIEICRVEASSIEGEVYTMYFMVPLVVAPIVESPLGGRI